MYTTNMYRWFRCITCWKSLDWADLLHWPYTECSECRSNKEEEKE
jgi:DNA-directed RNA polymerase subunit RPC12/RpoP